MLISLIVSAVLIYNKEFRCHGFDDPPTRQRLPNSRCRSADIARFDYQGPDYQRKGPARRIGNQPTRHRRWNEQQSFAY
jgi:hypothetical protein